MKNLTTTKKLVLSAMFLGLALVLPFLTGQIPQFGSMLCPMHLPVLLCGFLCGGSYGLIVGALSPILRSFIFSMPPMFPTAFCMAFELATYGLVSGLLYQYLPKTKIMVWVDLILAMVIGRIVWGSVMFIIMGLNASAFGWNAFISSVLLGSIPGIILQLVLVPTLVIAIHKIK